MLDIYKPQSEFAEFEYRGWEQLSDVYDTSWGHVTGAFVPHILAELGELAGRSLLDVATGPGYGALRAQAQGALVTGVDFSPNMVRQATARHPGIAFGVGDVHDLPFRTGYFDTVICNFGAQHFCDLQRAFDEMVRVMRSGGTLGFTIWACNSFNSAGDILDRAVERFAVGQSTVPTGPSYHELSNDEARVAMLVKAGLAHGSVRSRLVMVPWTLTSPDELFFAEHVGSVRSGAHLRQQTAERLAVIREAMASDIEANYRDGAGFVLPMAAYVVQGVKP